MRVFFVFAFLYIHCLFYPKTNIFGLRLGQCFIDEHMFLRTRLVHALSCAGTGRGVLTLVQAVRLHDSLFVDTNIDRSDCVHIALGALQT